MDSTNKIFAGLAAIGFVACIAISISISYMFISQNKELIKQKDLIKPPHPYNTCIKMFIKQADRKEIECDFEKAKSVCFDLIQSKKEKE